MGAAGRAAAAVMDFVEAVYALPEAVPFAPREQRMRDVESWLLLHLDVAVSVAVFHETKRIEEAR